jgi:hypothetical protein
LQLISGSKSNGLEELFADITSLAAETSVVTLLAIENISDAICNSIVRITM